MADKPQSYCRFAGCHALTTATYCVTHRATDSRANKKHHNPFYDSKEWRKLRAQYLKHHILCERCEALGRTALAQHLHHIKPVKQHPELALEESNLQALCRHCHDDVTHADKQKKVYDFGRSKRPKIRYTVMKGRR